jgi:hypothetical protein
MMSESVKMPALCLRAYVFYGMRPGGVGLRRARASWGLRPTRPGLAAGGVPAARRVVAAGSRSRRVVWCVHAERADPVGPALTAPLVGEVGFAEGWGVPDDAGVVGVPVVGLDVADGVALVEEDAVVAVVVEVGGDGSVAEVRHGGVPFLLQRNC